MHNSLHTRLNDEYPVSRKKIEQRIRESEDAKRSAANDLANKEKQCSRVQGELQQAEKKLESRSVIRLAAGLILAIWIVFVFIDMSGNDSWVMKLPVFLGFLVALSIIASPIALFRIIISSIFGGERREKERKTILGPKQQVVYSVQKEIQEAENKIKSAETSIENNKAELEKAEAEYSDLLGRIEAGRDDIMIIEEDVLNFLH